MNGKVCLITGANAGIGRETAIGLAKLGARIVMVCRDRTKGELAREEIQQLSGNGNVELIVADLSSQSAVRAAAAEFQRHHDRLDVLINNAGGYIKRRQLTTDGIETQLAVNHLAPFLLTTLLLELLKKSAPARIVNVASEGHRAAWLRFDNLQGERFWNGWLQYCNTKLMNLLFTRELSHKLVGTGVTANACHPGVVRSNFARSEVPSWAMDIGAIFMIPPSEGARTSIFLASDPAGEKNSGLYWVRRKKAAPAAKALDDDTARSLWSVSAVLTGLEGTRKVVIR
ncbi:MAG: SDR family oxidoreductase [Deltaproteobacteria bacterium]|nr:SDR family oxidoreductase [Deltaproteobacteria bacterium]